MKAFEEVAARNLTPALLQRQLQTHGYALIRRLLPTDAIQSVLTDIAGILSASGWLHPSADPLARVPQPGAAFGDPDPIFKRVYRQVFNLESFHALPHHPALRRVMELLVGDQVLVHPK